MPTAIVVGHRGQDGTYLVDDLRRKGYRVVGIGRSGPISVLDREAVVDLIRQVQPSEIYYLAASHHSSEQAEDDSALVNGFAVHVQGLTNFLHAVNRNCRTSRLFYAASAHVFGDPPSVPQDESTPFAPTCAYGITKAAGVQVCRLYRRDHGIFCSAGILYNHESPRRPPEFVSRKISRSVAAIRRGEQMELVLGNLDATVDWGAATDYVDAMQRILAAGEGDDFVVATGQPHTVGEFARFAFESVGLDSREFLREDGTLIRKPVRRHALLGDSSKLQARTQWRPTVAFDALVRDMVQADLNGDNF